MEITLTHGRHGSETAQAFGIPAQGRYLEDCWLPVVGPSTVLLTRVAYQLAVDGEGRAVVPAEELAGMLGVGRADAGSPSSQFGRTLTRAGQFGLGEWSRSRAEFRAYDTLMPVPHRRLHLLTERNLWRHAHEMAAAAVRLRAAGQHEFARDADHRRVTGEKLAIHGPRATSTRRADPPANPSHAALDALDRLRTPSPAAEPPSIAQ